MKFLGKCRKYYTSELLTLIAFVSSNVKGSQEKDKGVIYILLWTSPLLEPFNFIPMGKKAFDPHVCEYHNCFVTDNKQYLKNVTDFDAILFNALSIKKPDFSFPTARLLNQKYIFVSTISAALSPVGESYNDFFNGTWTYKLDSDVLLPYLIVKNKAGEIIGPKENINWLTISEMDQISFSLKQKLKEKRIAAAWLVSNCNALNHRMEFFESLKRKLSAYKQDVHIYGKCGEMKCPERKEVKCQELIESDYYFYLAFENSFAEDYVTTELLHGLNHFAVPIVYGTADYRKFMPDGIYLNARELGSTELSARMMEAIRDPNKYYPYFRWHEHYSFHDSLEFGLAREFCALCAFLNRNATIMYPDFVSWWNEQIERAPVFDFELGLNLKQIVLVEGVTTPAPPMDQPDIIAKTLSE